VDGAKRLSGRFGNLLPRHPIKISHLDNLSLHAQEIAETTGEALGTIHTRARLALQKLREELDKEEFEG